MISKDVLLNSRVKQKKTIGSGGHNKKESTWMMLQRLEEKNW